MTRTKILLMTVIHLISGLNGGGAEHFLLELCNYSVKKSQNRTIVVSLSSINTIEQKFRDGGIEYYFLHIDRFRDIYKGYKRLSGIMESQKTRNGGAVIMYAHMFHACMIACAVKFFRYRFPLIFTLQNNYVEEPYRRLLLFMTRFLRNTDIVFPGSNRKWYQKRNAVTIGNGIVSSRYVRDGNKDQLFTCIFLGRLEKQKNPLYLIELANSLRNKYTFRIRVVGSGSLEASLREKIKEHHLEDFFELTRFCNEPNKLLSAAHCLLLPSLWEGMPLVLLEAGAAGVPVIATPVGAVSAIANSSNAFIGKLVDFPRLLEEVINNYPEAMIKSGRLRKLVVEKYDIEKIADQHELLYRNVQR